MKHSVIFDVDTGIDDAMALIFAVKHPDVEVKAVTCVAGNTSVDNVVANTLRVLDLAGAPDIPVAAGATRPLIEPARNASWIHGPNGLADIELPETSRVPQPVHAVELLRRELLGAGQPVTIIALAPLTNLALLLRTCPQVAGRIERIVFMGGSATVGNASAVAEFNIWHDPEAASIVLSSGVPLTMYGLDVFKLIEADAEKIAALKASANKLENVVGALLGYEVTDPVDQSTFINPVIGDAGAVCALVAPDLFTFNTYPVQVELAPGYSRGQTLVDRRVTRGEDDVHQGTLKHWPRVDVAMETVPEKVLDLFFSTISA